MATIPNITIVVPLYNTEQYVIKCLDSIFSQTYKDFECIVVDDGSTDNSLKLCIKYAEKENRLKIIHLEKSGVCKARNVGIKEAKGNWITFIDSDDFIDSNYLESFIPHLNQYTFCTHRALKKYYQENGISEVIGIKDKKDYQCNNESENYILLNRNHLILASSCFKMFSKDILKRNNIHFDENIICVEDRIFVAEYLLTKNIEKIAFIDNCAYNYVIHQGSSTTKKTPLKMYVDASMRWLHLLTELNKKFDTEYSDIVLRQKRFIKNQMIDVTLNIFNRSDLKLTDKFKLFKHIKKINHTEFKEIKLDKGYRKFERILEEFPSILGFALIDLFLFAKKK